MSEPASTRTGALWHDIVCGTCSVTCHTDVFEKKIQRGFVTVVSCDDLGVFTETFQGHIEVFVKITAVPPLNSSSLHSLTLHWSMSGPQLVQVYPCLA